MQRIGLNDKKCAACRWRQGEREAIFRAQRPFKVECDAQGACAAIGAPKSRSLSCSRWVPWERQP